MNSKYNPFIPILSVSPVTIPKQVPVDSYTGFIRGNLFADLYKPYLRAEPFALRPTDDREALLNKVREYDFAMVDLNLYLDNFPSDREKLVLYNKYLKQKKLYTDEYEKRYGPLSLESDVLNNHPWLWLTPPWPWEVK